MKKVMTGTLYPHDRVKGLIFSVERTDDQKYIATLITRSNREVVDQITLDSMAEVGTWLEHHQDW